MHQREKTLTVPNQPDRDLNSRISDSDARIASARTIREWMEIYVEILELSLREIEKQHPDDDSVYQKYKTESRPRLKRILRDFEVAGLNLMDEIEFEGVHVVPGQAHPIWEDSGRPYIAFYWPDGQALQFVGDDAISAVGFFIFWQAHQDPVLGAKVEGSGESRIINPGEADHKAYFKAKAEDQGTEG